MDAGNPLPTVASLVDPGTTALTDYGNRFPPLDFLGAERDGQRIHRLPKSTDRMQGGSPDRATLRSEVVIESVFRGRRNGKG